MITAAYWISPQGKILDVGISKHIDHIIQYPESFGLTPDQVKATYAKYNEKVGVEGHAREDLILQTINNGFIRVRFYKNSRWSITLTNINNRTNKNILHKWAQLPAVQEDKYMSVHVLDIATSTSKSYTVRDLAAGDHLLENEENDIELIMVTSASQFNTVTFKEFIKCQ